MSEENGIEISENYIIQSLIDPLNVLRKMMEDLSPNRYYSIIELTRMFPEYSQNKIYRIIMTFLAIGWVEKNPHKKEYKIGHELLYLSHRYLRKLDEEHLKIRDEVNSFNVNY